MAFVDVVKHSPTDDQEFVSKFPSENLRLGSQLIVTEGQVAIFVKGGQAFDVFFPGTYTLTAANIPLLEKLINFPFGGNTPFTAEVWFVATTSKRDLTWGTPSPIPIMDESLGFPVSARSYGTWGARIRDPKAFVTQLVGAQISADSKRVSDYFIGEIIQCIATEIAKMISAGQVSILQIATMLREISDQTSKSIGKELDRFGIELVNFNIQSINIPDSEVERIQSVFAQTLEAKELSKAEVSDSYRTLKSFDIIDSAANNDSDNAVGALLGAGLGLGAGLPIGTQMAKEVNVGSESNKDPNIHKLETLKSLFDSGLITEEEFTMKKKEILDSL